jgi:structural maintenance of chromosomes protein 6
LTQADSKCQIDNALVQNQLIINNAIEQTVLIPERFDGHNFMNENPNGRPQNVKSTLTHSNKAGGGLRFVTTGISQRVDPIQPWAKLSRIQTDNEAQIRFVAIPSRTSACH